MEMSSGERSHFAAWDMLALAAAKQYELRTWVHDFGVSDELDFLNGKMVHVKLSVECPRGSNGT
jgi:hypothetical protein